MIQLELKGVSDELSSSELQELRAEFAERQCVFLPKLVSREVLDRIRPQLDTASFHLWSVPELGAREEVDTHSLRGFLLLVIQRAPFFRVIEEITGYSPIRGLDGTVNRLLPQPGHHLLWHRDTQEPERLLGISIHLGSHPYEGGRFQLRDEVRERRLADVAITGPGDAIVFGLAPELSHRVTPVVGEHPRITFAGWLLSESRSAFQAAP